MQKIIFVMCLINNSYCIIWLIKTFSTVYRRDSQTKYLPCRMCIIVWVSFNHYTHPISSNSATYPLFLPTVFHSKINIDIADAGIIQFQLHLLWSECKTCLQLDLMHALMHDFFEVSEKEKKKGERESDIKNFVRKLICAFKYRNLS